LCWIGSFQQRLGSPIITVVSQNDSHHKNLIQQTLKFMQDMVFQVERNLGYYTTCPSMDWTDVNIITKIMYQLRLTKKISKEYYLQMLKSVISC
jgi:hypothetical protein